MGVERELSDMQLIEKVKDGHAASFEVLMRRHKGKVASVIKGMLGNTPEAEDVGQDVFIRFYKTIDKFKGDSDLSTYLVRIAINLSINAINKRKKRFFLSVDDVHTTEVSDKASQSECPENRDLKEILDKAIRALDPKYRKVVVLRLVNGYSTKETAEILDVPVGTVLSRLARGQKKLQDLLKPYYDIKITHKNTA